MDRRVKQSFISQGSPYLHLLFLYIQIKALQGKERQSGTTNGTTIDYYGRFRYVFHIMEHLTFSGLKKYESGSKKGRFYIDAPIPKQYLHLYKQRTIVKQLGSNKTDALRRRDVAVAQANRELVDKVAEYDPLLVAGEKLIEELFKTVDIQNRANPPDEWLKSSVTIDELQGLKHYVEEESPEKTEYNRLLGLLRMEVHKLLSVPKASDVANEHTDFGYIDRMIRASQFTDRQKIALSILLDGDQTNVNMNNSIDEQFQNLIDEAKEQGSTKYDKFETGTDLRRELDIQQMSGEKAYKVLKEGKTKDDQEFKDAMEKFIAIPREDVEDALQYYKLTLKAYNRQKQEKVSNAFAKFEDEHLRKTQGKGLAGKRFSEAIEEFKSRYNNGLSKIKTQKTFKSYMSSCNYFLKLYGDKDLSDIDEKLGNSFVEHLEERGLANESINRYVVSVRAILTRAKQKGWIEKNEFDSVDITDRGKKKKSYEILQPDQLKKLFSMDIPEEAKMLFRILATTGFRLEEGASLEWEDIKTHDQHGEPVVHYDLTRPNMKLKTDYAIRKVPIHSKMIPFLDAYRELTGGEGRLFSYKAYEDSKVSKHASKSLLPYVHQVRDYDKYRNQDNVVVHSLRGTFTSIWSQTKNTKTEDRLYIGGWEQAFGQDSSYLNHNNLPYLKDEIERLKLDFIETKQLENKETKQLQDLR